MPIPDAREIDLGGADFPDRVKLAGDRLPAGQVSTRFDLVDRARFAGSGDAEDARVGYAGRQEGEDPERGEHEDLGVASDDDGHFLRLAIE